MTGCCSEVGDEVVMGMGRCELEGVGGGVMGMGAVS